MKDSLTLHQAIEKILKEKQEPMSSGEIAYKLNKNNWYKRGDGKNIKSSQITARVNSYLNLFEIDKSVSPHKIRLINTTIKKVLNKEKVEKINEKTSFPPIFNTETKILILGTMPGDKSLELSEYYADPRNRFWKVIARISDEQIPKNYTAKKELLERNKIGIWDVAKKVKRKGSLDSDILNPIPNDLDEFVKAHKSIKVIGFNGLKAKKLFYKFFKRIPEITYFTLLSTSSANTKYTYDEICKQWRYIFTIN